MTAESALSQIAAEVAVCARCALHQNRIKTVPGEGPPTAEIMLIGEAPGKNENEQGRPFVGAAGKLLGDLLAEAGLTRADVWIGNVVKCRPPENRDPLPEELAACNAHLDAQIAAIAPKIIITLGRFSMGKFLPGAKISQVHGQIHKVGGRFVIAMFHPAAALHNVNIKPLITNDFARLPQLLEVARRELSKNTQATVLQPAARADTPPEEPTQMKLF